jgi:hypothetical protein
MASVVGRCYTTATRSSGATSGMGLVFMVPPPSVRRGHEETLGGSCLVGAADALVTLIAVANGGVSRRLFLDEFDDSFFVGTEPGNSAFFGRNVLRGLVDGIDDFIHLRQQRWSRYRPLGPALLGSAMWINDSELIHKIGELYAACIVVNKQGRKPHELAKLEPLAKLNQCTPGMPIRAFSALTDLAPKEDGQPVVLGPYSPVYDGSVPTIRTLGFRKLSGPMESNPPILHAKLALLGHLWWHDEDGSPGFADVIGFRATRLWVSSANFTSSSRRSLEFGYWTEDPALVQGAERFLINLMRFSEALDPESDSFDPELAPVDYDDEAMAEAMGDMRWDDADWDYDG